MDHANPERVLLSADGCATLSGLDRGACCVTQGGAALTLGYDVKPRCGRASRRVYPGAGCNTTKARRLHRWDLLPRNAVRGRFALRSSPGPPSTCVTAHPSTTTIPSGDDR